MAGIRKREIVGCTLVVALFGAVASPAFAVTVDLGQTSVSTDTTNLVQAGSTGSSPSPGGSDAVSDTDEAVTDISGASPEIDVDATPATDTGTGEAAAQTGSESPPLPHSEAPSEAGGRAVTDIGNAAGQTTRAAPRPKADPAAVAIVPKAVTPLASKAPKVVDTVQEDASTIVGAVTGGGGSAASKTLLDTATGLTHDTVGTVHALVDAVHQDASTVVEIVAGGGGLPGVGGAITYVNQALDPPIAIPKDPIRLVSAAVQQLPPALSPPSRQLRFAGLSPGPGQPSPGVHAVAAGPTHARTTARRATSGPGTTSVVSLRIRPLAPLGIDSGTPSAVDRAGAPFRQIPGPPPRPELPALGGVSFSTSLSFGAFAALAVLLAAVAARPRFIRRLALAGGRPVGFALLLDRPG